MEKLKLLSGDDYREARRSSEQEDDLLEMKFTLSRELEYKLRNAEGDARSLAEHLTRVADRIRDEGINASMDDCGNRAKRLDDTILEIITYRKQLQLIEDTMTRRQEKAEGVEAVTLDILVSRQNESFLRNDKDLEVMLELDGKWEKARTFYYPPKISGKRGADRSQVRFTILTEAGWMTVTENAFKTLKIKPVQVPSGDK